MALFGKNPNEVAYTGGKKHWTDVIKNTGEGEYMIWRQPEEDFNTNSTLVVMPGEEAIFIKGGVVEEVFENGTYKLSTENYPFISRLRNAFSGGISTFNCVVYFVRKAHSAEILWGTDSPIQVRDKLLGIATELKSRGSYKVQIDNPVKFLEKLIGNNISFQTQDELNKYFINEFQSKVKSVIARALNETNTELLGIDARLDEFSETIQPFMQDVLEDYGLKCIKFSIAAIDIEDDELRRRYDEIGMDAIQKLRMAQADKGVLDVLGEDWTRVQGLDVLKDLANNPGAGGIAAAGAGMGMGIGAAGAFGSIAQQVFSPITNGFAQQQQTPSQPQPSGRFTQQGAESKESTPVKSKAERFKELQELMAIGALSQEEFEQKRKEIIDEI